MAKAPPKAPTTKTKEFFESNFDEKAEPEFGVLQERASKPNIVKVKHKVTGKEYEVSRKYYETYSQVLDLV